MFKQQLSIVLLLAAVSFARGQVAPAANGRASTLSAGATIAAFIPYPNAAKTLAGYPNNVLTGVGAFVDFAPSNWWGIEAEGHWLRFHEFAQIHEDTYLVGPRLQLRLRHFRFYGKALYGFGEFGFPYEYAQERTPLVAFGGGAEYTLTRRISVRALDGEFQHWLNFQNHGLSPYGASAGVAYRLF